MKTAVTESPETPLSPKMAWVSNIFYHPAWIEACKTQYRENIETYESHDMTLALQPSRWRWGVPLRILKVWENPYVLKGSPFVRHPKPEPDLRGFLKSLQADHPHAQALLWPNISLEGPFWDQLQGAAEDNNMPLRVTKEQHVAICTSPTLQAYESRQITKKALRRTERRLQERGWSHNTLQGDDTPEGLERFLTLEAAGWKGKRGTALACRQATRLMVENIEHAFRKSRTMRVDEIWVENTLAASLMSFVEAQNAIFWKMTYNENLKEFSLGTWLLHASTQSLLKEGYTYLDGYTYDPNSPIMRLWDEREKRGTVLLGLSELSQTHIERWAMREKLRHRALSHVKDALRAFRD